MPLDSINDGALVGALRRQMTIAAAKQVAAAGNLANADTPSYKAIEPTFAETLEQFSTETTLAAGGPSVRVSMQEVEGLPAKRDGNTVQIDRELLSMGRAGGDFSAAQTALAAKFRLVRYAINEGR